MFFVYLNLLLISTCQYKYKHPTQPTMITYKQKQPKHTKTLQTFSKIFEDKHKWHIHSNKWHRLKSELAFSNAEQILAEIIELYSNKQPRILSMIRVPGYPNLRQLNLKNNKMESIDMLRELNCVQLRVLNLADNHLTQVTRALNRVYLPQLQVLILYANNIVEIGCATRTLALNFNHHHQHENTAEIINYQQQKQANTGLTELILGVNIISDMRWVNKLSHTTKLTKLSLQNNRARQNVNAIKRWGVKFDIILI